MIGRNGERRSGISTQAARHDDDDDDIYLIYMYKEDLALNRLICHKTQQTKPNELSFPLFCLLLQLVNCLQIFFSSSK